MRSLYPIRAPGRPGTGNFCLRSGIAEYQWKQVFLPPGTRLCASFSGQNYFAQVEGDAIKCGEQAMSPSQFANLQTAHSQPPGAETTRRRPAPPSTRNAAKRAWSKTIMCAS